MLVRVWTCEDSEDKQVESKLLPPGPYIGCHPKVWSRFKVDLPTLNDLIKKKDLSQVYPDALHLANSRCSHFDNQEWPSQALTMAF